MPDVCYTPCVASRRLSGCVADYIVLRMAPVGAPASRATTCVEHLLVQRSFFATPVNHLAEEYIFGLATVRSVMGVLYRCVGPPRRRESTEQKVPTGPHDRQGARVNVAP